MPLARRLANDQAFGLGGGSSFAEHSDMKPTRLCEPSQKGLFSEQPQRQRETILRPARPHTFPVSSAMVMLSPSTRSGPLFRTMTLMSSAIRPPSNSLYPRLNFQRRSTMANEFLTDIQTLRKRARQHIEKGAVTEGYTADLETVVRILNEALATEIVCVLRYKRHYYMATGIHAQAVAAEFLEHANEEQGHADQIAARITQLG